MTQDKMRRIITACTAAVTALLVFLLSFLIYQWISMAILNKKIEKAQAEVERLEQQLEEDKDSLQYYQTQAYLQAAYQKLQELENQK
ncbi:MAG: hypothetical protein IJV83_04995 [Clostridia bacterium]|nr:hypothetical protein [Clostridia bacterium]